MLVDSHCHLDFPELAQARDAVLARADAAGVRTLVTISTRVARFAEIRAIAEAHPQIYCTIGTHPHNAAEEPDVTADDLLAHAAHEKVVGIGEAGLDHHYDNSPREAQENGFRVHIDAARRSALPLVIHARSADEDIARILEEESARGSFLFVLHCFSGGAELARRALALGGYISFSGILTFKNAASVREVAGFAPLDRILVETDAPFLAPVPHRGKPNEPGFVRHTAETLGEIRGLCLEEMAAVTTDNFFRLFSKAKRPDDD